MHAAHGFVAALAAVLVTSGAYTLVEDARYCGAPARDSDGVILRDRAVLRQFQQRYPCPSTGKTTGACPGWYKDHVVPLVCGGCDTMENLQWLPGEIKSCGGKVCKDRWEQRVYCKPAFLPQPAKDTP